MKYNIMVWGRRGEIVWKKLSFWSGKGQRDYDTHLGWGLLGPFYLTQTVHTFGWGKEGQVSATVPRAQAIPLRPDRAFRWRTYIGDWSGPLLLVSGLCFLPLLCSGVSRLATILTGVVLGLSLLGVLCTLTGNRARNVRLILGRHDWGSSDPATWSKKLLKMVVDSEQAFGVASWAKLARKHLKAEKFSAAMWAARLCTVLEDANEGETLTDEILDHPEIRSVLSQLRRNPRHRHELLGKASPLTDWIKGDPDDMIFLVKG